MKQKNVLSKLKEYFANFISKGFLLTQKQVKKLHHWDILYFEKIQCLGNKKILYPLSLYATKSGDGYLYPLVFLFFLYYDLLSGLHLLGAGLSAFALKLPIYRAIKDNAKRLRPFEELGQEKKRISPPDEFSLPSGHTAAATVMVSLVGYFYPILLFFLIPWLLLLAFSRIYLGVHYPTDLGIGFLLGIFSAAFGLLLFH